VKTFALALSLFFSASALAAEPVVCVDDSGKVIPLPLHSSLLLQINRCANAQRMQIHAHRGAGNKPENTMAAFREAIKQGADTIELDLQITKDDPSTGKGTVVVTHDADLRANQCLDPAGNKQDPGKKTYVRNLSLEQVKQYDCGSLAQAGATPVPGERIATLAESMELLKQNPGLRFNIEIKYPNPKFFPPLGEYVDRIIETVEATGVNPKQFFFQSFQHETLAALKKKRPEWEVSPLVGGGEEDLETLKTAPYKLGAHMVTPHFQNLSPELLAKFRRDGIKVVSWTANTRPEMLKLIDLGADGIITDRVDLFQDIKKELCGQ
jgi:glycerophosphoryl diester phosphodiesterase